MLFYKMCHEATEKLPQVLFFVVVVVFHTISIDITRQASSRGAPIKVKKKKKTLTYNISQALSMGQ